MTWPDPRHRRRGQAAFPPSREDRVPPVRNTLELDVDDSVVIQHVADAGKTVAMLSGGQVGRQQPDSAEACRGDA